MVARLLRIVRSRRLPCGCFVGVYEAYDGRSVEIIDDCGPFCRESTHRSGAAVRSAASRQDRHVTTNRR